MDLAHNKLYRNFIILQEDERGYSVSSDKALSGYAKVEAKGDKCKVSFYAQNLKQEDNYSMVLICCKRDFKQLIDLGPLKINEVGKGDTSKEYYINNIAGLGISYEKISGAAICKIKNGETRFIMYGLMNGEELTENWRKFDVIKVDSNKSSSKLNLESKKVDVSTVNAKTIDKEKSSKIESEDDKNSNRPKENIKTEILDSSKSNLDINIKNKESLDLMSDQDRDKEEKCDNKGKEPKKEKIDKECMDKDIEKLVEKLETFEGKISLNIQGMNNDFVIYGFIKDKADKSCNWKKFKLEKKCENKVNTSNCNKRIEENITLDGTDFQKYENDIANFTENDGFDITGKAGKYFEKIAEDFEPYNESLDGINYCKWYRVNVNSIEDLCDESNNNKYTLAYYPMLNYYPYISKDKHFLLGYKCNQTGELQYIVYGIPGSKDKEEQPYGGKTGFVTWTNDNTRNKGYWLMFYDYKNSSIVVPMK